MEKLETDKLLKTTLQDKINYYSFKTMDDLNKYRYSV